MQVQDFNIHVTLQSMCSNDFGKYFIKRPSVQTCHYLHMILIKIQVPIVYIFFELEFSTLSITVTIQTCCYAILFLTEHADLIFYTIINQCHMPSTILPIICEYFMIHSFGPRLHFFLIVFFPMHSSD